MGRKFAIAMALIIGIYNSARANFLDDYTVGKAGQTGFFESNVSAAFVGEGGFYSEVSAYLINKETDKGFLALPFFTIHNTDPIKYQELGLKLGFIGSSWENQAKFALSFGIKVSYVRIGSAVFTDPFDSGNDNEKFIIEEQTVIPLGMFAEFYALFRNSDHIGLTFTFDYRLIPFDGRFENGGTVQQAPDEELFEFKLGLGLIVVF